MSFSNEIVENYRDNKTLRAGFHKFISEVFPSASFMEWEKRGFWTRGPYASEIILKTYYPVKRLDFRLLNNPRMRNEITVQVGRQKKRITLGTKQRGTLSFSPVKPFKIKALHLYRIKIRASKGSTPYYESETSKERRFLGVFFEMNIVPEE